MIKYLFPILTNKNNEETDNFEEVLLPRQRLKLSPLVRECERSTRFLLMSLDTSLNPVSSILSSDPMPGY